MQLNEYPLEDVHIICDMSIQLVNSRGPIQLVNSRGVYYHHGSDHTSVILDYHKEFNLNSEFTLLEFVDACYRIKSHKFDKYFVLWW